MYEKMFGLTFLVMLTYITPKRACFGFLLFLKRSGRVLAQPSSHAQKVSLQYPASMRPCVRLSSVHPPVHHFHKSLG